jgi:histidine ammonia-lyase
MTRRNRDPHVLELTGAGLSLADVEGILHGRIHALALADIARRRVGESRRCLEVLLAKKEPIYGVNTGFGKLSNQRVDPNDLLALQENLVRSHSVGMGDFLCPGVSRLVLALRIQVMAAGFSGVTPQLLDALMALFNHGVTAAIPEQGSVGASGDLAPLAHLALVLIGEGKAFLEGPNKRLAAWGKRSPVGGAMALRKSGLEPYELQAKEGLSLINGTQVSTAILADALIQAWLLARTADVAGAMTVEATRSSFRPFDARIQVIRGHKGQIACAANLRRLLDGSEVNASHASCQKVQDAYSMRCMPQVHGAMRDGLTYVTSVVEMEINSVTDNPLVFPDTAEVISGGNFHAQPIAQAADLLAAVMTDLGSIAERRVENLVNPDLSGLPGFLTPQPGLNSGMMMVQVLAAALVAESRALAFPAGVDSIPTSANREDHVSMAPAAARKARTVVKHIARILACEVLCAAQGLDFLLPLRPSQGVGAAWQVVRRYVRPLSRDRTLHRDLEKVEQLILSGRLLQAAEAASGKLE